MDARAHIDHHAREFIDDLKQWLAIPSISADPEHAGDVRRSAGWLAAHLKGIGFPVAEVWETAPDGLPAVFAEWPAADPHAPVALIYGHHDVQPVDPLAEWDSPPFEPAERDGLWARPTAEVNGIWGGHTGAGSKTIIPRAAHAKVSFRLVADQDPADVLAALREYARAATPAGLEATVTGAHAVRPSHSPITSPAVRAGRRAMERAFGREVLFTREGGSGPEADLAEILAAPLVFIGVGLDSDRPHAPNERIDLSLLLRGAEVSAYLWQELAGADLT